VRTGDDLLQSEPPELPVPVGIVSGHIERERHRAPFEHGIGVLETVVEGEAGEAPVVALLKPQHGLIEGDHVEPGLLHLIEHRIEEFRGDLKDAIGRESLGLIGLRPHMVQGEDHAHALRIGGKQAMGAGMIEPRHRRLHHGGFHLSQGRSPFCAINH
jgi:hypothetical protein